MSDYEKVRGRNYYTVNLGDGADRWRFLARTDEALGTAGLWFPDNHAPATEASVPYMRLGEYKLSITYYFAELELRYTSAAEFILHYYLGLPRLWLARERLARSLFNRRKLVRTDRMTVLRLVFDETFGDHNFRASAGQIMTMLYGPRWARHPDNQKLYSYYDLLLRSLAVSQDLQEGQHSFKLSPNALRTISEHEEEDRRHRDQINQQRVLGVLTFALVVIGAIQVWVGWVSAPK